MGRGMGGWVLMLCVLAGCSRGPSYVWDAPEGAPMAAFGTVALDPRTDLVWASEGRRPVNAGALPQQALKVIQAKGYAAADGAEAGLWLDVILMTTDKTRTAARGGMRGGMRSGGGMRGGGMDGGMRGGGMEGGRMGMDRSREEGPRPERMERGAHAGGGLRGELRLAVQVLSRVDGKLVWYGAAELPEAKEGVHRQSQLDEALRTLLEKVPPAR